jgi:septal ring factor EnvC (AmiA/AmiB activator)
MTDEEIGKIRLMEFNKGVEFASSMLNKEIAERDQTIKDLREQRHQSQKTLTDALHENQQLKLAKEELRKEKERLQIALGIVICDERVKDCMPQTSKRYMKLLEL